MGKKKNSASIILVMEPCCHEDMHRHLLERETRTLSLYSALMMLQFKMDAHVVAGMVMILVTV